jgi:hypothetical protein
MSEELSKLSLDTIKYFIKHIETLIKCLKMDSDNNSMIPHVYSNCEGKIEAYNHCKEMLEDILRIEDRSKFNEKLRVKDGMD